jgi:hypothetical protein
MSAREVACARREGSSSKMGGRDFLIKAEVCDPIAAGWSFPDAKTKYGGKGVTVYLRRFL